jgi:hypothetical protein
MHAVVVLAFAVVARSTVFDNWHTPPSLMIIFLMGATYSAYCAFGVRKSAESARRVTIENMTRRLAAEKAAFAPAAPDGSGKGLVRSATESELAQWLINDVTNMRKGAFAPLSEQPFWKAFIDSADRFRRNRAAAICTVGDGLKPQLIRV